MRNSFHPLLFIFIFLLLITGCNTPSFQTNHENHPIDHQEKDAFNRDYSTTHTSSQGNYTVGYSKITLPNGSALNSIPFNQHFSLVFSVAPTTNNVKIVNINADMPEHKHGMNTSPTLSKIKENTYRADGMLFHMIGWWQINVDLQNDQGISERVSFNVNLSP